MKEIRASIIRRIMASHVAGPDFSKIAETVKNAQVSGWKTTIALWTGKGNTPTAIAAEYLSALHAMHNMRTHSTLAIKPASLQFDSDLCNEIVATAKQFNIQLHLDSEHPDDAARSFTLFESLYSRYENIGWTLPARWRRSLYDIERIIEMRASVRIVKGQWNDIGSPVRDVRKQFLELVRILSGKSSLVSIATHDAALARSALCSLTATNTLCELEQMFGLPWIDNAEIEMHPVVRRMYIPYGQPYLPYNYAFIKERPGVVWWMTRDFLLGSERKKNLLTQAIWRKSFFSAVSREKLMVDNHLRLTIE